MKTILGIATAWVVAAGLAAPVAWSQASTAPRARSAENVVIQRGGTSYLGIGVKDIDSDRAKALNLKEERGVEVTTVNDDGPAAKAGLKEGDVVLEYNHQAVESGEQFARLVRETPVGRQVKLAVWRNGASQTLTATVGERKGAMVFQDGGTWNFTMPPMPPMPQFDMPRFQMTYQNPMLGIEGEALGSEEQLAEFFGVKEGVLVKVVRKNSAAEKAGIKAGDVIVKVDDTKVTTTQEITSTLRKLRGSKRTFSVTVVRNRKEMPLTVTMEERTGGMRAIIRNEDSRPV